MADPKPEPDDADIAQAFLSTLDAARKLMPPQIAKDLRTVQSPLSMTRGRMDGWYGVFATVFMCVLALVVPIILFYSDALGLPPIHRGDWIPAGCTEIGVIATLTIVLVKRGAERRLRRFAAGRCIYCGYDLTATPDRCPECGNRPYAD
jgi:hypothetical protein